VSRSDPSLRSEAESSKDTSDSESKSEDADERLSRSTSFESIIVMVELRKDDEPEAKAKGAAEEA
jgi:hypothetical protein